MRTRPRRPGRPAFTLLELLIVLGILGVVASVSIVAISPRRGLLAARDAERAMTARGVQNAVFQYQIDHGGALPGNGGIPEGPGNALPVCAQGVTENPACVQLDLLVPAYLSKLPKDVAEPCPDFTGYLIDQRIGAVEVTAAQTGKMPGDSDVVVSPGCGTGEEEGAPSSSVSSFVDAIPSSAGASSMAASSGAGGSSSRSTSSAASSHASSGGMAPGSAPGSSAGGGSAASGPGIEIMSAGVGP
jgi:prepilin-type N-terminal cleavage/methylation domain-containing protein